MWRHVWQTSNWFPGTAEGLLHQFLLYLCVDCIIMVYCAAAKCQHGSGSGFSMHSFPINKTRSRLWVRNMNRVEKWRPSRHSKLCAAHFEDNMFVISPTLAESIGYGHVKSARLIEDAIPTIFAKPGPVKTKRASSLMQKLDRQRVCLSDNRSI